MARAASPAFPWAPMPRRALISRIPVIYYAPEWVNDGGLVSYGVSFPELYRRAATYVDKILKGGNPAELPVEQPTKLELVVNLKTAKQIDPERAGESRSGDSVGVSVRARHDADYTADVIG